MIRSELLRGIATRQEQSIVEARKLATRPA
jgi:hypothetical protein